MKYIKTYEKLLKKTDTLVLNHPLNKLIEKFIDLLTILAEIDNLPDWKIIKYYTKNTISIIYKVKNNYQNLKLFSVKITTSNEFFYITEINYHDWSFVNKLDDRTFVKNELWKINKGKYGVREFNFNDIDYLIKNIDNIIKELEIKKSANKYNI